MHYGLTHWDRATHIWVRKLTIIGSDNGLSPRRRQAIIWTKAGIFLIGPLWTNFGKIIIEIYICLLMHYNDVLMGAMVSQIARRTIVYSTVYSGADQRNTKAPRHWPLWGEFTGDRWIPAQRASNAEIFSIWWRHHGLANISRWIVPRRHTNINRKRRFFNFTNYGSTFHLKARN